jgi:PEGA domain-containing protein
MNGYLLSGAVVLALVTMPATASAQRDGRHHGEHHGGRAVAAPVAIVGQLVVVPPTVVYPVVAPPVVVQPPISVGWETPRSFPGSGFGSVPVRTGFGALPVRTGFENTAVRTGFGVPTLLAPGPVTIDRRQGVRSPGFRAVKPRHVQTIVVGYAVPYSYVYPVYPPYDMTSPPAYYPTPSGDQNGVQHGRGVSASASTYWMDLANEPGASSGLTFNVSPARTEVYVDGVYTGIVQDFSIDRPLMVVPGSHGVELRAPGYRTIVLDVNIVAGQVIPYEGELRPY